MLLDLSPLRRYRDYRLLLIGQTVSFLGSMITFVAVPWQVYELTRSSFLVGLLGAVQLVPVLVFGLIGGSVADAMDRRKLLWVSELIMSLGSVVLAVNAYLPSPSVTAIFVATALMQAANGFHRPAMDAMTQKLVEPKDYPAVSALGSLRYSVGAVLGPAVGGVLIATGGAALAYWVDVVSFGIAMVTVLMLRPMPIERSEPVSHLRDIGVGLRYAWSRPELLATYIVDIVAMTFAFPTALFPALGESWGGAKATGMLFSAMAAGSLAVSVLSGWTSRVRRHGAAVVVAASIWGLAIVALGFARSLEAALLCLFVAGAADMVSGMFRQVIWNESIPNAMRGRLAGIEMISYMSGPLLGNTRAGWMASATSLYVSIGVGGAMCTVGVVLCAFLLPQFWRYRSEGSAAPKLVT